MPSAVEPKWKLWMSQQPASVAHREKEIQPENKGCWFTQYKLRNQSQECALQYSGCALL